MNPQQTIERFAKAWIDGDFTTMYNLTQLTWQHQVRERLLKQLATDFPSVAKKLKKPPKLTQEQESCLKSLFPFKIVKCEVLSVNEVTKAVYDATLTVTYIKSTKVKQGGKTTIKDSSVTRKVAARMIGETKPFTADPKGVYGVNPISLIKSLY